MKEFFKQARTDKIINRMTTASVSLLVLAFIYVAIRFFSLPLFIPIFNQLPWGNERVGRTIFIFIPLLISIAVIILNLYISSFIYSRNPLLARIVSVTSVLVIFLILIFSVVIVNLVI